MKLDSIKDVVVIAATGGALLLGLGKFIGQINDVPRLNHRVSRLEHQSAFLVQGIEKLTHEKYVPPRGEGEVAAE